MKKTMVAIWALFIGLCDWGPARAQLIDFETVPGGTPAVGVSIFQQYQALYGVSFRIDGSSDSLYLGDYGNLREGWRCQTGALDCLLSPADVGAFFLAHPQAGTPTLRDVLIDYAIPTDALGFDLADVDGMEEWEIRAYGEFGNELAFQVLRAGEPGTGDGIMTNVVFEGVGAISQVRLTFTGTPNPNIGFGFDNFTPSCPGRNDLVTFETVPGETPAVGLPITDQYAATLGVSFSVEGGADTPFLGDYGGARDGWYCNDGFDCVDTPGDFGRYFLAHPDQGTPELRDFIVDYTIPTPAMEFDLADIDGLEEWTITLYDEALSPIETRVIRAGDPGTGDSQMTHIALQGTGNISRLRIAFSGTPSPFVGFGFDNFNTRCSRSLCDLDVDLDGAPATVERGGTFSFNATAHNACEIPLEFDEATLEITGPASLNDLLYSGPPLTVGPGDSVSAMVSRGVPSGAPLGLYQVRVSLWRAGTSISSAQVEVEVR